MTVPGLAKTAGWGAGDRGARAAWLVLVSIGIVFGVGWAVVEAVPVDAKLYWDTNLDALYGAVWGEDSGSYYVYPPVLAQLMVVVRPVGWPLFVAAWTVALFAATAYAGRGWALALVIVGVLAFPIVGFEHPLQHPFLYPLIGNIQPILVACVVAGFRFPWLWSVVLLTKIGPGIGVMWFAFRGEWASFTKAVVATGAIAAVSLALAPELWNQFFAFAARNAGSPSPNEVLAIPLPIRLASAIVLLAWGARTNRRWTVPIAAGWSAIALYHWTFVEFWMAAPVVWAMQRRAARAVPGVVAA